MNKPVASSRLHAKPQAAEEVAGDNLLSRWTHYHRPRVLIGRVRDGNGSFHPGQVTGKSVPLSGVYHRQPSWVCCCSESQPSLSSTHGRGGAVGGAAKRSAVSTG